MDVLGAEISQATIDRLTAVPQLVQSLRRIAQHEGIDESHLTILYAYAMMSGLAKSGSELGSIVAEICVPDYKAGKLRVTKRGSSYEVHITK